MTKRSVHINGVYVPLEGDTPEERVLYLASLIEEKRGNVSYNLPIGVLRRAIGPGATRLLATCFSPKFVEQKTMTGDFSGTPMWYARISDCTVVDAEFKGCNMSDTRITRSRLVGCDFTDANFTDAVFHSTRASNCNFSGATIPAYAMLDLLDSGSDPLQFGGARITYAGVPGAITLRRLSPIMHISPIGSRQSILTVFFTVRKAYVLTGCFAGSLEQFCAAVRKTYPAKTNYHRLMYDKAAQMIRLHVRYYAG